jgi:RNA polymerase sigma factor (sigma-70 family)
VLLAELFDAHAPMVLGLCRSLLRDPHEAEDAAQQTFLSAYGSLVGGTAPRQPAAWLATIARNECRTRAQRRMREPLPVAEALVLDGDPYQEAVKASEVESLRVAVAHLPRQQREAFVLREFTGLSYEELAVALGVTQPAVESLLFRARRQLRSSLRAVAAAALSVPTGARDLFAQLLAGSADGAAPTTLAKLGAFPLGVKLAALGAGGVIGAATVVAVAPTKHHGGNARVAASRPKQHVAARVPSRRPSAESPRAAPIVVSARGEESSSTDEHSGGDRPTRAAVHGRSEPQREDRGQAAHSDDTRDPGSAPPAASEGSGSPSSDRSGGGEQAPSGGSGEGPSLQSGSGGGGEVDLTEAPTSSGDSGGSGDSSGSSDSGR